MAPCPMFQFHEGPIKTVMANLILNAVSSFNSMKVRLKQSLNRKIGWSILFQFHEGPIKTKCVARHMVFDLVSIP